MHDSVPISSVRVGRRHRKDMGDLDGLVHSLSEAGLLQPIGVTSDLQLVFGGRRLAAAELLGWDEIPAHVVDFDDPVLGEFHENEYRKNFSPEERVHIGRAIEARLASRQGQRQAPGPVENFPQVRKGQKTRQVAAERAGFGNDRTYRQAKEIVEAAEAEPERFSKLVADMNRTGRVNGPHKRLKVARQAETIRREPPPLPNRGPYRVIVADPPWQYDMHREDLSDRATYPYPQMTIAEICALPVTGIAHEDSILWLWTTNFHMPEAFRVLEAWGFSHVSILTWVKDRIGRGDWLRGQTEHTLLAIRGRPVVELKNQSTVLHAPVGRHSEKPAAFYDLVEALCPAARYAELFARNSRPNWDGHGNEVPVSPNDEIDHKPQTPEEK